MPELVNAIANGAGRCDAAYLNKFLYEEKKYRNALGEKTLIVGVKRITVSKMNCQIIAVPMSTMNGQT